MNIEEKVEKVVIDLTEIKNIREVHMLLKKELDFPGFYGMNWDAFWDAITGLVELPDMIVFKGWNAMIEKLPNDAEMMTKLLDKYNECYPEFRCTIRYE